MKKEDMIAIGNMRLQGKSAGAIAVALGLSVNTGYGMHPFLPAVRETGHAGRGAQGKEVLLRPVPQPLVEQPPIGDQ